MTEKTSITLVQNVGGQVVAVRIGDAEIPVMHAGPVVGPGQTNLVMTLANVEIDYAQAEMDAGGSAG
ncbi:hypothetical protein Mpop_2668 [Methylorubrum populi BJ001]|jgi:hypothetical protein|uniref:Uncharacterized protein n=1 Tax=Methylorubrum populi (strain ATCC BAA-705 / NCIMB 13946 / BJ001) TaxID=441620 RepID=B1ZCD2_METPB|nr:hypothetical protein [Methylorubrum populi]ACB80825.1 hypothetical protein Mpop_2668 [Methylorubrum populi BJ001]